MKTQDNKQYSKNTVLMKTKMDAKENERVRQSEQTGKTKQTV